MKKVMVFGTFDLIHPGHTHLLKEAKEYGDYLTVVIARDETVCSIKGKQPINNENQRLENIKKLNIADNIRLGCIDDKYLAIAQEKPDIIALGYDQKEFVDNLTNAIEDHVQIVRISPYKPEVYHSSKLTDHIYKEE